MMHDVVRSSSHSRSSNNNTNILRWSTTDPQAHLGVGFDLARDASAYNTGFILRTEQIPRE